MKIIFLSILFLLSQTVHSQNYSEVEGNWKGSISVSGQDLNIAFTFSYSEGELDGMIDIPQQNAFNLPVEFIRQAGDSLIFQFETGTGPAVFNGKWDRNESEISGEFDQLGNRFPFSIIKSEGGNEVISDANETNLIIPSRAGQIAGSLKETEDSSKLVILLTGSGAQDRDESVGGFKIFGELATQLYSAGFSSFRYDDRGVGESRGETDATLSDLAEDLVDVIDYFEENYPEKFTNIILLGHSQGGLVAAIAEQERDVAGIIFMGAPFLRGDQVINQQIFTISEAQGINEQIVEENLAFQNRIYDVIRTNGSWEGIEQDLYNRLEAQINELPEQQRNSLGDMESFIRSQINRQLAAAKTDWFKSFIEFEPESVISELEIPMLAIFGEKDSQVIETPNREAAENLNEEANLNLQIISIPEANHLFQKSNSGLPSEYGMLERSFADGFVDAITNWLNSLD